MNDNAKKLVEALRSGEFKQAKGALRTGDGFCCLGVACETYRRITGVGEWEDCEGGDMRFLSDTKLLPPRVREFFGFSDHCGTFGDDDALYELNDNGTPLDEIAALIESEPPDRKSVV